MAKLSKSMTEALREIAKYLADPFAHSINRAYNRRRKAYCDRAYHCNYEWFKAATEAGLVPGSFDLRRCWTNTTRALVKRGLVEVVAYDWELRGEPHTSSGLRLTEAGRKALEG
ncbi:MAG: hypothetical protein GWN58_32835 [Anaerolineae bacterium]|nr:hypothetical protein [Thermoplasmata archaeon]NIV34062.1 hypothetical protein [Anaerolineae bacterium]NIY05913.1 hypothetical protein [Thermoplasmata archaeon]